MDKGTEKKLPIALSSRDLNRQNYILLAHNGYITLECDIIIVRAIDFLKQIINTLLEALQTLVENQFDSIPNGRHMAEKVRVLSQTKTSQAEQPKTCIPQQLNLVFGSCIFIAIIEQSLDYWHG